ncbi:MAG: hypothetical protein AVDCRST_MAG64-2699 [uncultured Phycisphaerae bacterium]|uniref:PIN domain-containing protein n=1 Tax=uncultured Phycisphaerae bacterium TaxID=904963 RepID=A0A6J4PJN2_9BACT|nr:MAG: hypothetical protein AVDCRST_MAG64-2699 [uncultured Phycisphaerae bacterium]
MFLLDTNCWMQIARNRPQAGDVRQLLLGVPDSRLFASIYSVHSIGTILQGRGAVAGYAAFLAGLSIGSKVQVLSVPIDRLHVVEQACITHRLDFDDAYQYAVAELHDLKIVSLDADFDRTPRGRLEPLAALSHYQASRKQNP